MYTVYGYVKIQIKLDYVLPTGKYTFPGMHLLGMLYYNIPAITDINYNYKNGCIKYIPNQSRV